ncbi:MAG: HupE/UreJ family protein [Actinomycetota bacterium]|nr:HupE/UreJ family protein [Actinomycetota bacterium]
MRVRNVTSTVLGVLVSVAALLGLAAAPAGAHTGDQAYLYLDVAENELAGRVELPYGDVRTVFGLSLEGTDEEVLTELEANAAELHEYADAHLSIGAGGEDWPVEFDGVELLEAEEEWTQYVVLPFEVDLDGGSTPRSLDVGFDPFFDEIDGRDALLLIANDWGAGVIDNTEEVLVAFDGDTRSRSVDLGDTSQWTNFTSSIELGVDHIRTGPDHIAFVLVLLLPSVLVFVAAPGSWAPGRSFGQGLWRVLKIVTMFTVAHSITFSLAGLGLLPLPPSKLVESIIAVSIAAAALHNLRPVTPNREWLLAFGFGLFHGLGFASLVSGLDVSRETQLVSLLGRNVGIEIGQAIVILMTFPALFLVSRTRFYRPFFVAGSIVLAAIAIAWTIERVLEIELGISRFVDEAIAFPRSIATMVLATAIAAGLYWWEQRNGRLLATADPSGAPPAGADDPAAEPEPAGTDAG